MRLRRWALLAVGAGAAWFLGCGDETPSSLGSKLRVPPDSLHILEVRSVVLDSVYPVPVSLGRSPVAQIGRRFPYTSHELYDFQIPTRTVRNGETLGLDEAHLVIRTDSFPSQDITGSMRLTLREVAVAGRSWTTDRGRDSVITSLPPLEPDAIARDTVLVGSAVANRSLRLDFDIQLNRIVGYDSVRAAGGTLTVNMALLFAGFDVPGRGFLEYTHLETATSKRAQLIGFTNGENDAIATVGSAHERLIVLLDPAYSPGTKLAVSDGYRLHSFIQFPSMRTILPESALVFRADLLLTQMDSLNGIAFGEGPDFGVVVPNRDSLPFDQAQNELPISFRTTLVALPGSPVSLAVTPYIFDQQEGHVPNRGMILRISNEGTKARHFEFYGGSAPDSLRPRLRIFYGYPAQFEGGDR